MPSALRRRRRIGVVYGRRRGRPLRPGQQDPHRRIAAAAGDDAAGIGRLDPEALFGAPAATIWLEIGFGGGEHLAQQAERHPEIGFIGCEVFENGIASLLGEIERRRLGNIRIFADDARLLIAALPPASIDRVFILFPDPWPKRRHHKRRIVSRETLDRLAEIMTDEAELRLATDDRGYLCWMLERRHRPPGLRVAGPLPRRLARAPADWPPTRYEEKARAAGRSPAFLRVRRRLRGFADDPTAKLLRASALVIIL